MTEQQDNITAAAGAAPAEPAAPENPLLRHADLYFAAEDIDRRIDARLLSEQGKITLPGFRRGKVPLSLLRQRYGETALQQTLQEACGPKFHEILKEKNQRAAAQPRLQLPAAATDGRYKVHCHYEILPDIAAADFSQQTLKKPIFTVDDAAVDEMVEILRAQRGVYVAADEAAGEEGDYRLRVDYKTVLPPAADGEDEEVIESGEDRPLSLADKNLRAELKDGLTGVKSGDERSIDLSMPDDLPNEKLRGRAVRMTVTVRAVEKLQKAELDETFFSFYGEQNKTLDDFRGTVREHLQRESKTRLRNFLHNRAMTALIAATPPFPMPQTLLMNECYRQLQAAQNQWKQRGMAETAAQLSPQMFLPEAQRRTALGLILSDWKERHKPEISSEEVEARLQEIVQAYEDPAAAAAHIRGIPEEMEGIYLSLLEDRVTDWVTENCKSEDAPMTLADFLSDSGGAG